MLMSSPEEDPVILFPSGEVTPRDRDELLRLAAGLGFSATAPQRRQLSSSEIRSRELERHVSRTYPQTTSSFLGKEHFWKLCEEVGAKKRDAGVLFHEICFPMKIDRAGSYKEVPIPASDLGLTVMSRQEVDMPRAPFSLTQVPPSRRLHAHFEAYTMGAIRTVVDSTVVQMAGVIELARNLDEAETYLSSGSRGLLEQLLPRLEQFPDSQL